MSAEGGPLGVAGGGESGDHRPSGHPYPRAVARSGHLHTNSFCFATDAGFLVFLCDSDLPDEVDGP